MMICLVLGAMADSVEASTRPDHEHGCGGCGSLVSSFFPLPRVPSRLSQSKSGQLQVLNLKRGNIKGKYRENREKGTRYKMLEAPLFVHVHVPCPCYP